jgi:hypothetical protein
MTVCYNHCNNNAVKGFRALWDNTVFTTNVSATLILLPLMAGNKLYSTGNFLNSCVIMSFSGVTQNSNVTARKKVSDLIALSQY